MIRSLLSLIQASRQHGSNLMTLLQHAARRYPDRVAILGEGISYQNLLEQSLQLAGKLVHEHGIQPGKSVGFCCRNHMEAIIALFALARTGADVYLLNPDMSESQQQGLIKKHAISFVIDDKKAKLFYHQNHAPISKLPPQKSGNIVVLTSGSTGFPKSIKHRPSPLKFVPPFFALLSNIKIHHYKRVYIGTPLYHGFGFSALLVSVLLGAAILVQEKYEAKSISELIKKHEVEVMVVVPLMLSRCMATAPNSLRSVKRILCGGAPLSPTLASACLTKYGDFLFNLYGTSEAGFSVMAKPQDLRLFPDTIGKPIRGAKVKILNPDNAHAIGEILFNNAWSMSRKTPWVHTGDLGYQNSDGYLFLFGRKDDMIVSGGENVYPFILKNSLSQHPDIQNVTVKAVPDKDFGTRLKVWLVSTDPQLDEEAVLAWLKGKVARYEMPVEIVFVDETEDY